MMLRPSLLSNVAVLAAAAGGGGGPAAVDISMVYSSGYTAISDYGKTWSAALGADDANRHIVVAAWCDNVKTMNVSIGGNAATKIVEKLSSYWGSIALFRLAVPTGTPANISLGVGGDHYITAGGIIVYRVLTATPVPNATQTYNETSTTTPAISNTVNADGGAIVAFAADRSVSGSWSNASLGATEAGITGSGLSGFSVTPGTAARTWTGTSANYVGVGAAWDK